MLATVQQLWQYQVRPFPSGHPANVIPTPPPPSSALSSGSLWQNIACCGGKAPRACGEIEARLVGEQSLAP